MTDDDRKKQIETLFHECIDLSPHERERHLEFHCKDETIRKEVEDLLKFHNEGDTKLEKPPVRLAPSGRLLGDPEMVGSYRILERLGEGGFGVVFAAEQTEPVRRRVALKVLKAGMDTEKVLARFEAERQALALMSHENISRVLDAGATEKGRPYFVMELVRGDAITAYCDRHRLGIEKRLKLFSSVCLAMQHAHQKGIIHRDLKPANILITLADGEPTPKVIDFGIAKAISTPLTERTLHTMQGEMIGTPHYMSPEQAERTGLDVDTTTDVYSLGVILYELLCGHLPFEAENLSSLPVDKMLHVLRNTDPEVPSSHFQKVGDTEVGLARVRDTDPVGLRRTLKSDLDWIVMRAMGKDRTHRYQTALELSQEIQRYLDHEPVLAGPPTAGYRMKKFMRRHRVALSTAGVLCAGLVIAAGGLTYALIESNRQREVAERARAESEAVTAFFADMLESSDPWELGPDVRMTQVLDQAGQVVGQKFEDRPLIEARLRLSIGTTYRELGDTKKARDHLQKTLDIRNGLLEEVDPLLYQAKRELLRVDIVEGKYKEANAAFEELYTEARRDLGPDSEETLRTQLNLAASLLYLEEGPKAIELLEDCYERAKVVLGEDNASIAQIASALALSYDDAGRSKEAEVLLREVLEGELARFGSYHPHTITVKQNLASILRVQNRYEEAAPLYEGSVESAAKMLGEKHIMTMKYRNNLALFYSDMGDYEKAEEMSLSVVRDREEVLGLNNSSTLASSLNLALLYLRINEYQKCIPLAQELRDRCLKILGPDHLYTAIIESTYGQAELGNGNPGLALEILQSSLERHKRRYTDGKHWRVGHGHVVRGEAHFALGQFGNAEADYLRGYEIMSKALDPGNKRIVHVMELLVALYKELDDQEKQTAWQEQLASAQEAS